MGHSEIKRNMKVERQNILSWLIYIGCLSYGKIPEGILGSHNLRNPAMVGRKEARHTLVRRKNSNQKPQTIFEGL